MKGWAAAVMALSLTAAVGRAAELGLAFDAHLGPGTGGGEARAELIIGALDLYASAAVGEAPSVTVGGAYQTASASLRLEIELFPEGFVGTAGAGWEIVPDLGIEVEIEGGSGGLVGAALLFWYGVPVGDAGGSEVRGLFEFDGEGSLIGQVLSLGLHFPPWEAGSIAYFDAGGFTLLRLEASISGETLAAEAHCELDPAGFSAATIGLSLYPGPVVEAGLSWSADGSWEVNGAFRAADSLGFRAELSRMDALYRWATAVSGVWGGLEITLGLEDAGGGLGCSGSVLAAGDVWSIELRGAYSPAAGWDLWVSLGLSLDVY